MGLLDRWTKKQTAAELAKKPVSASSKPSTDLVVEKSIAAPSKSVAPAAKTATIKATNLTGTAYKIIVRPLVTEKSSQGASLNQYSFVISKDATKIQVARAVKELYDVKPVSVNVINMGGRRIRFGKSAGRRGDYKKAIVTLPKGSSITIHEGV